MVTWDATPIDDATIDFSHHSAHLDEGYPGELDVTVRYRVTADSVDGGDIDLDEEVVLDVDGSRITNAVAQEYTRARAGGGGAVGLGDVLLHLGAGRLQPARHVQPRDARWWLLRRAPAMLRGGAPRCAVQRPIASPPRTR